MVQKRIIGLILFFCVFAGTGYTNNHQVLNPLETVRLESQLKFSTPTTTTLITSNTSVISQEELFVSHSFDYQYKQIIERYKSNQLALLNYQIKLYIRFIHSTSGDVDDYILMPLLG